MLTLGASIARSIMHAPGQQQSKLCSERGYMYNFGNRALNHTTPLGEGLGRAAPKAADRGRGGETKSTSWFGNDPSRHDDHLGGANGFDSDGASAEGSHSLR